MALSSDQKIEQLVEENMAFIIRTVSSLTGRYVSMDHDDVFSIALSAFVEAIDRYDEKRGAFLSFAKLVIQSRVTTFLTKEQRHSRDLSLEELAESGVEIAAAEPFQENNMLTEEIQLFKEQLAWFGLTLETLAQEAPRHRDTRVNAIHIGRTVSQDEAMVELTYQRKRLPIRAISRSYAFSEKILKRSKSFILAVLIIFAKKYRNLLLWIKGVR